MRSKRTPNPRRRRRWSFALLLLFWFSLSTSRVRAVDGDVRTVAAKTTSTLFLLTGFKPPPTGPKAELKKAELENEEDGPIKAQLFPRPLPQTMLPRNVTADALKPPLMPAQVAPPPRQLVDVDVCRGYFDVMGHFDSTFNCSKGSYIYCCGTCHYRFCCEHQRNRLDQDLCTNYKSPHWLDPQVPVIVPTQNKPDPDFETLHQQNSSTAYVIGGVISFTVVVAVGVRIAFSKVTRRPRNRDVNVPRSLVDILRHQSSPVQQQLRNNATCVSKSLYTPVLQSKDNRTRKVLHHFSQQGSGSSPKHTASIERGVRMNNTPHLSSGPSLLSSSSKAHGMGTNFMSSAGPGPGLGPGFRHLNNSCHSSFSHSFHNLNQLPPSYETVMKPEISRYSSLKKLEKDLDDSFIYFNSKRRFNNPPLSFHSSQHHLPVGGDFTLGPRGTLPINGSRPRLYIPTSTPNPYPLPGQHQYASSAFERPPRRVRSQDQLLAVGEGNTLSRFPKNPQQPYYKSMMSSRSSASQTLRRSHERLLVSPDHLDDALLTMGLMVGGADKGGGVPTMGRLSHHQKAQSQQNICVTPSMDRHHMIKMNSHPTSSHDHDPGSVVRVGVGLSMHGGWDGRGTAAIGGHPNPRRMAFATKRQNTIEQLHFIPGGAAGGQGLRTGSKNEVTV